MTYTEELERGLAVRIARMLNFVNQVWDACYKRCQVFGNSESCGEEIHN